ncbi:MAG: DMT family transporter [Bdellovibrionales bacterium]|nr:DMT family transporter [Bdellovibrionales bacterium]
MAWQVSLPSFHTLPFFGEFLALSNAILWSIAVIILKKAGLYVRPIALNLFKLCIGFSFLMLTLLMMGQELFLEAPWQDYFLFCISGIMGIAIADTLFLKALNILGASRIALVDCLYSPFIMVFSYFILGESMTLLGGFGAMLILASIPLTSKDHRKNPINLREFITGSLIGALSMALMGFGIVMVKPLLSHYPVFWVTTLRTLAGLICLSLWTLVLPDRKQIWSIFKPQAAWKLAFPSCFLASYPSMLLWVGSFAYAKANIAALLTQVNVVLTVLLAAPFLGEPLTRNKILAMICAFLGVMMILW